MADISANAEVLFEEGSGEVAVLYRVHTVDTGDTIDVSEKFSKVKAAVSIGAGAASAAADVCSVAGTTVTLDAATNSDETLYVLVVGNADG